MGKRALVIKYSDAWNKMTLMRTRDHQTYDLSWDTYGYFCSTPSMIADRDYCETDASLLQIIPYIVLYKHLGDKLSLLTYVRGKGGTETRLHDKLSVGLGGHIEEMPNKPEGLDAVIYRAAVRELEEELGTSYVSDTLKESMANILLASRLNRDHTILGNPPTLYHSRATPVDEVHLGVFTLVPVTDENLSMDLEKGVIEGASWMPFSELTNESTYTRLETWSKAVVDNLTHVLI